MTVDSERLDVEILGRLAPGVAHDFNNLLAAICADADLARRTLGPGHPAQELVESILATVAQGMSLTAHVLANSRQRPPLLREVQLQHELQDIAGLLRRVAGDRLEVRLALSDGLPEVIADPTLLGQALFRLAARARTTLEAKGELLVEARLEAGAPCLVATVSGAGLPAGLLDQGTERRSALERLAEDHGARLTLAEEPGRAIVRLDFPRHGAP